MLPLTFGRSIFNEGAFVQTVCTLTGGDEPLRISWSFHGHNISSDQGIRTTNVGSRTSILMIENVGHRHRGNYTCMASNKAGNASHTAELKINGREIDAECRGRKTVAPGRHSGNDALFFEISFVEGSCFLLTPSFQNLRRSSRSPSAWT